MHSDGRSHDEREKARWRERVGIAEECQCADCRRQRWFDRGCPPPAGFRSHESAQESREQHALGEAARAMGQWPRNA